MDRFAKLREAAAASAVDIERGEKPRLQGTLANLYFGFNPGDFAHERRAQLRFAVGEELTAVAERGFVALLTGQPPPVVADVARMNAGNEYHPHWYAILAGMDLYWEQKQSVDELPVETLAGVFALSLLLSTWDEGGHLAPASRRPWSLAILRSKPEVARRTYEVLLTELLRGKKDALGLLDRLAEGDGAAWRAALAGRLRNLVDANEDPEAAERLTRLIESSS